MSQAGVISASSSSSSNQVFYVKKANINGLVAGTTTIFTPANNFVVVNIILRLTNVSGVVGLAGTFFVGTNNPTYDNIETGFPALQFLNDTTVQITDGLAAHVSAGTPIVFNVFTPENTATTYTLEVYLTGFYDI